MPVSRVILMGPPCAGKSTVGRWLERDTGIGFVSSGDLYRENRHALDPATVQRVDAGGLMSDEETLGFLKPALGKMPGGRWILDGVPRSIGQAALIEPEVERVFSFEVEEGELFERMRHRQLHPASGRLYSPFQPPLVHGRDDVTGEPLARRVDDTDEAFARRLAIFRSSKDAIEAVFEAKGKLVRLTAATSRENYSRIRTLCAQDKDMAAPP